MYASLGFVGSLMILFLQMLKKIGATLIENVEEAHTATHMIASDGESSLPRTPKLMIAMCCTANIVSVEWLKQSATKGKALPPNKFLLVDDKKAEKTYNFSMRDTLKNINANLKKGHRVLEGWHILVCNGVAGNNAPGEEELKLIISAAGGTWITSSEEANDIKRTIVITKDPEPKRLGRAAAAAVDNGARKKSTKWLFHTLITQELNID